ncbi:conserved hypothetical protein [Beggiatoa sp. PS]|nr:conserved hypothetical protein [Beggiatoa sp. PS]
MQEFATLWNNDQEITDILEQKNFNANIGYGLTEDRHPTGILIIVQGKVEEAGLYEGQSLDWDLRADFEDWTNWLEERLNLAQLGFVVADKKLQFRIGNHKKILRTPSLATVFLRSFELMSQVASKFPISLFEEAIA